MSDIQSVPSTIIKKEAGKAEGILVNTNVVLQNVLQQLSAEDRNKIVLRCDDLPYVQGNECDFEFVFSGLLQMILQKKENVSKLFLHINCKTEEEESQKSIGFKSFCIQFKTNIISCADWFEIHEEQINKIATILHKNGSSLAVNQMSGSGCIFSVSIPGKTL
jgi:hypothetical protein